jgi:pimeloyl-ACP methyl ester carboxylesterase
MALSSLLFAASLATTPCTVQQTAARCATFDVPEARHADKARSGRRAAGSATETRKITLRITILPATKLAVREPLFVLAGGPGQAAASLTGFAAQTFAGIREEREIVFVDQRGTGESNPLMCDMGEGNDLFPPDRVSACAKELASRADFRLYTTAEAVEDLDAVRQALGWKQINLFGTSYGTRVALEYLRAHPSRVRAVILKGVVAPQLRYSIDPALGTQASFDRIAALVPSVKEDAAKAMAAMPRDVFSVQLRNSLHSVSSIEELPAALRDPAMFERNAAAYRKAVSKQLALGMYFSVVCSEDVWRASDAEVREATAGTIPGDYWHQQLVGACAVWPHASPHRTVTQPVHASAPALLVSGGFDPVTPPKMGDYVAKMLPNSRHVVVANASHSFEGLVGCIDVMMVKFLVDPDPKKVDESCTKDVKGPKLR